MKKQFTNKARYLGLKLTAIIFALLLFVSGQSWGQPWTYDFGSTTGAHTSGTSSVFLPTPTSGSTYVRVGTTAGSVNLENSGTGIQKIGSGIRLRVVAPTSNSVVKASVYNYTPGKSFYTKFSLLLGGSTGGNVSTGTFSFWQGDGASFSEASAFSGTQMFTGIRFVFGASGAITTNYRATSTWTALGSTPVSQGNVYTFEIFGNNTTATINYSYNGASQSVAANKQDIWINGSLIGDELAKAQLGNDVNVDSWMFYGETSSSNEANLFLDDVIYSNSIASSYTSSLNYFSKSTGNINTNTNFTTNNDGTGAVNPSNFTGNYTIYNIRNNATPTIGANWTVSGTNSKIVVGDGTNACNFASAYNVTTQDLEIKTNGIFTLNVNKELTVNGTLTNSNGAAGLVLKSDATGTASLINSTAGVSATVERYLTGNVFHQLGLPISNTIAAGTSAGQTGDVFKYCTLDSYDEATNNYVSLGSTNSVTPDKGYVVKYVYGAPAPTFRTLSFAGTLNTGTVNIPMSKTADGYNLIPNPYPSSIDWNAASGWTKNVDANNSIYIWKSSGQWTIFDGTNDININGGVRYIAPGQAFFIKAAATGNITMDNNVRVHNATSYLKSANTIADNLIKIKVSGNANSITDEAVVYFANNPASSGSEKWFSYEATAPSLYTVKSNKNYAINVLSDANTSIAVPMAFKAGANGNYTLKATEIGNFTLCSGVTLEDLKTGSTQNILTNTVYNFTATTTDNVNRFILHFASSVGVNEIGKTNGGIYAYDNNIYVNANEQVKQIAVYNTIGQLVKTVNNVNGLQKINMNGNATGYYIVKVICDKNVYSEKVLIK